MEFTKRIVKNAKKGLSQEEALESLYSHPQFVEGSRVSSIRQSGGLWIATLLEPKNAEFPPIKDEDSDSEEPKPPKEEDDSDSDEDGGPDIPESPEGPKDDEGKGPKGELGQVLQLLHEIVDALGIGPEPALPGAEDGPPPGLDAPPAPPAAKAPGPPKPAKPKLRPGETPPGVTPINTPAFSSVDDLKGRVASFSAKSEPNEFSSVKEAKASLEATFGEAGYKVKQIKRNGTSFEALLSVR
jgi:hypothetical protein